MVTITIERMNVALIGSTGGGTATLGHTDAETLMETIHNHLVPYQACLRMVGYIALDSGKGMDGVNEDVEQATLYAVSSSGDSESFHVQPTKRGLLRDVNQHVRDSIDNEIAEKITNGTIHGLICISCSPTLFQKTFKAAAVANIPITGSGGTSLSQATDMYGVKLVGNAGGSVATTTSSRAASYTYALASHWGRIDSSRVREDSLTIAEFRSVLNASLPAFWTCCLLRFILEYLVDLTALEARKSEIESMITLLATYALPTACCVAMTQNNTESKDTIPVASILVAVLTCRKSILSGLLAGWMVRYASCRVMQQSIALNIPATMTTLLASGLTTAVVSAVMAAAAPFLRALTEAVRLGLELSTAKNPVAGFLWGVCVCYGSKFGWYHAIVLPLILVEMETTGASFLGAVDELALVLVCAGVCAGQVVRDRNHGLCRRGLRINLLYGDFVEACYPHMDNYPMINASCYLASGLSSALLVSEGLPKSMAYLPCVMSVVLAGDDWIRMALAACVAFLVPFLTVVFTVSVKVETPDKTL